MLLITKCLSTAPNAHCISVFLKNSLFHKSHLSLTRTFMKELKWNKEKPKDKEFKPLMGMNDPDFTNQLLKAFLNPEFKKAYGNMSAEFKMWFDEIRERVSKGSNHRIDSKKGRIDMLFTFDREEDLKKFCVNTDSSFLQGYSSASVKNTQQGTALFSGNISEDIPKDGNVKVTGYANLLSVLQLKSFYRVKFFDWTDYTHLVFKIRGDGHTYIVLINIHGDYEETRFYAYSHPLYTRGGPYWQIAKLPLSHFVLVRKGRIMEGQDRPMKLREIRSLGITALGFEGPFKLEIDYIGLEYDELHKKICPYEGYHA